METTTAQTLLELNRQFYQTFAVQFSATRHRLQPGVKRYFRTIFQASDVLDLGCGNGELARALAKQGFSGRYTGLDLSPPLLEEARRDALLGDTYQYVQADLASPDWETKLSSQTYDLVLAFAVLHHLPGIQLRRQVMGIVHRLLAPAGLFLHSEWQFLNSEKLRKRILPWEAAGLSPGQVDPGDHLLDWRQGGQGLRYVHQFSETELVELAEETGFSIRETYYSDGQGGRLGLYQIWKRV